MTEEKKFIKPGLEIVDFTNDDIITLSNRGPLDGFSDDRDDDPWGFGG